MRSSSKDPFLKKTKRATAGTKTLETKGDGGFFGVF
jgi:hypothetical protein